MFLTKQDFQKNVSRHDGKSKIVVKFHGVPIYTFCQDISFRESMMLAETIVSEILDGKNKTALMRIQEQEYESNPYDNYINCQYRINPIYYSDFCKYFETYIRPQM